MSLLLADQSAPAVLIYLPEIIVQENWNYRSNSSIYLLETIKNESWIPSHVLTNIVPFIVPRVESFRSCDSKSDRFFIRQDQPEFSWIYVPVDADIKKFTNSIKDKDFSYFKQSKYYISVELQNDQGWIYFVNIPAGFNPALFQRVESFRMADQNKKSIVIYHTQFITTSFIYEPVIPVPAPPAPTGKGNYWWGPC